MNIFIDLPNWTQLSAYLYPKVADFKDYLFIYGNSRQSSSLAHVNPPHYNRLIRPLDLPFRPSSK